MKTDTSPPCGPRPWSGDDPWEERAHPWMSAYCAFFALAMKRHFPDLAFAIEYSRYPGCEDVADHALVHRENNFYDARGLLVGYEPLDEDDVYTITYLEEKDLRLSGLLSPHPGLRDLPERKVLLYARRWIEDNGFSSLGKIPHHSY